MPREKWSKERILKTCQKLYKEWKVIPEKALMIKTGYQKLARYAIPKYFKNFQNLHAEMGIVNERRSPGYWTKKNTVAALRSFCQLHQQLLETMSISRAMLEKKMFALINAIRKHGGLKTLNKKQKLGIKLKRKNWTKARVVRELKELHQAGHVITKSNLLKLGKNGLSWASSRLGKLTDFKKAAGIPVKEAVRWSDESIIEDLKPIIEEYKFFPNASLLKIMGRRDLSSAISKNGGYPKFYKLLNMRSERLFPANDGHYLQSSYECVFDNILFKYNIPHRVHVRISQKYLYKCDFLIGKTYIEIAGYHRTNSNAYEVKMARKIRVYKQLKKKYIILPQKLFCQRIEWIEEEVLKIISKIDFQPTTPSAFHKDSCIKPPTYWADFKNIESGLQPFISRYGRMPTIKELYSAGKASLANAIYKYHGTTYDIAQRLQIKSRQVSREYYTLQKTIADYKQLCIDHNKYLTLKELYGMNLRSLAHAINKLKGFQAIRRRCKLGFPLRRIREREYLQEQAIADYRRICKKYRKFLTRQQLINYGFSRLAGCLNRHGLTLEIARERSGLDFIPSYMPRHSFTLKEVVKIYKQQCQVRGYFLSRREALTVLSSKVIGYIDRYIGYNKLKKMTNLKF
ncbi:MAG: hypothetical protein KF862_25630 [Chitinophagaceae bacterium]|nr:hypothetical protein [Chitinophagaceae bacterium]